MRTTISLDDDVLMAVHERARRERRTAGQVLSELAQQALIGQQPPTETAVLRYGFQPLSHRGPAVSNVLINKLRDDEPE